MIDWDYERSRCWFPREPTTGLRQSVINAEPRSAPVIEEPCGCKIYMDGDRSFTIYCTQHRPPKWREQ